MMEGKRFLSEEEEALFKLLAEEAELDVHDEAPLTRRSDTGPLPLSSAQSRLWFLCQLAPRDSAYHLPFLAHLQGPLDVAVFHEALGNLVDKHEILRTVFRINGEEPNQIIEASMPVRLGLVDFSHLQASADDARIQELIQKEAALPFDLQQGPLIRVTLLRLDQHQHLLLLTLHHIIADGWSVGVLIQEWTQTYAHGLTLPGQPSASAPLSIQYGDFTLWQRTWLNGPQYDQQMDYWRDTLSAAPALSSFPADRSRPTKQRHRGAQHPIGFDEQLTRNLKELAVSADASVFMVLLSGCYALLFRHTHQADLLIGSPIANRSRPELEPLIGFFANTLVYRAQVNESMSFRALLAKVRTHTLANYDHQDIPFEHLVQELNIERALDRSPLFQVMLVLQEALASERDIAGLHMSTQVVPTGRAKFDLTFEFMEDRGRLGGFVEYDCDLYGETSIQRLVDHFQRLLAGAVANPDSSLGTLPLSSEAELTTLHHWSQSPVMDQPPTDFDFGARFSHWAQMTPGAPALIEGDQVLTFQEVNDQANLLALQISARTSCENHWVAVYLERSAQALIGYLACWKAGAGYLALDPKLPAKRVRHILADVKPSLLISRSCLAASLGPVEVDCLTLDQVDLGSTEDLSQDAPLDLTGTEPAFLIYTSGSSGIPKGVVLSRFALANRLQWMWQQMPFEADERCCQKTSLSFVDAAWEMWGPLLAGIPLVILDDQTITQPNRFWAELANQRISRLVLVPSLLSVLLEQTQLPDLPHLKWVTTSGETLTAELASQMRQRLPQTQLVNLYGSSEVCGDVLYQMVDGQDLNDAPPIGKPIHRTRVLLVDQSLRPVAAGVAGEILVGGANLAMGYLGQSRQTALKFIPAPDATTAGERMFRSGDQGRFQPDGNIAYLGREDDLVKIRGFRIEPNEVASTLLSHDQVTEAIVLARGDENRRHLVAYVISSQGSDTTEEDLRVYLQGLLPAYMLPSHFLLLDSLPRTASGKIDKRSLLQLPVDGDPSTETYAPPRTHFEEQLVAIWADVLDRPSEQIGIHHNFFQLGGHSLSAVRMMTRITQQLGPVTKVMQIFEKPTVALLAEELTSSPFQSMGRRAPAATRAERPEQLPLSFSQQRLWLLHQLDGHTRAYSLPFGAELRQNVHPVRLSLALETVIARHETLRTSFHRGQPEPFQVVHPSASIQLQVIDLQPLDHVAQATALAELSVREAQIPFDLEQVPLFRCTLVKLAKHHSQFLLTMHHLIADGWSMHVFVRELAAAYRNTTSGEAANLDLQYFDYAAWQRNWLADEQLDHLKAYWRDQLQGVTPILALPSDRPRPAQPSYEGDELEFHLGQDLTLQLETFCQTHGVSPFMALLATFQLLLFRLTHQSDFCVGVPVANRSQAAWEALIGFFVNTLPLRVNLDASMRFEELLDQVKERALSAFDHQDLPFDVMVQDLDLPQDFSVSPLFQTMFIFQNIGTDSAPTHEMTWLPIRRSAQSAKFDITLEVMPHQGNYQAFLEYNRDLFEYDTIALFAERFITLLGSVLDQPQRQLGCFSVLSPQETRMVREWNDTQQRVPTGSISALFEQHAADSPHAVALHFDDASWTFSELNHVANQIARRLVDQGSRPGDIIGVMAQRSPQLVASILAVLKTGAIYLALDPQYPLERSKWMITDSGLKHLIVGPAVTVPSLDESVQVIDLSRDADMLKQLAGENLTPSRHQDGPMYLMYTSGSTGRPKGVQASHGATLNRLNWMWHTYPFRDGEVCCLKTSTNFVDSIWEMWGPLLQGIPLVLISNDILLQPAAFKDVLARTGVTRLLLVPSLLRTLLTHSALDGHSLPSLRFWMTSGEALPDDLVRQFQSRFPQAQLLNLYGSSEVAADVTTHLVGSNQDAEPAIVAIGRPIANTQVYVLDPEGRPVPSLVSGELYVGGTNLAIGYHQRPRQTAERFVPNPFQQNHEQGSRLYRTGDLVHYRANAQLYFLGRTDTQVKIRGIRLEPKEIAYQIEALCAEIKEAVVNPVQIQGDWHLAAFVVLAPEQTFSAEAVTERLAQTLPAHMVPSFFLELEDLPRTPNGKLDRSRLPGPEAFLQADSEAGTQQAPVTEMERGLAAIWQDVLDVPTVGRQHSFFELGGHSLKAVQVASRVSEWLGRDLSVRAIFDAPTLTQQAELLRVTLDDKQSGEPLVATPRDGELPLSPAQTRLWFLNQFEDQDAAYHLAYALNIRGELDLQALQNALDELIARHEILRTVFPPGQGEGCQHILANQSVRINRVNLQEDTDSDQEELLDQQLIDLKTPAFDLVQGPLMRATYLDLGPETGLFYLVVHHLIMDGWSLKLLIRELSTLYRGQINASEPVALADLSIQYADYSVWQQQRLVTDQLKQQGDYWVNRLRGTACDLDIPGDFPRPARQSFAGGIQRFQLPQALVTQLDQLGQTHGASLYMTLLTAFRVLLGRYTDQLDFAIGTPVANRNRRELEPLIGFFVNTLVLQGSLEGNPTFAQLLERERESTLSAFAHSDYPFEQLVRDLKVTRDWSRSPLFQVMFILQNTPDSDLSLPGLVMESHEVPTTHAMFDLTLELHQTDTGLEGSLVYAKDQFQASTIARLASLYHHLLTQICANPQGHYRDWDCLPADDRHQALVAWQSSIQSPPCVDHLAARFDQVVRRIPTARAIIEADQVWTFAEVDQQANRLAHGLLALFGQGRQGLAEQVIGLRMVRGAHSLIAMLAVLKAGGAFLALDPDYPEERLNQMIADANPSALLTLDDEPSESQAQLPPVLSLAAVAQACQHSAEDSPQVEIHPEQLAYMIYTSGSSGVPKGVLGEHRATLNRFEWAWRCFPFENDDVCCQRTALNFVDSIWECFGPLLAGIPSVIVSKDHLLDPAKLAELLESHQVTRLLVVPSLLANLLAAPDQVLSRFTGIRLWVSSGEPLKRDLQERFKAQFPQARLFNFYGSSEVAGDVTSYACDQTNEPRAVLPAGTPNDHCAVYILDDRLRPAAIGAVGELFVAGRNLTRGYHAQPKQTATRLIPNPFSDQGGRLYATGDRGRYRQDGVIELFGRRDHQVKIRGVRIELDEIDHFLRSHPAVGEAAVITREADQDIELAGFVVPAESQELEVHDLREHLKKALPVSMVPNTLTVLEALPLTPNGKIDRLALHSLRQGQRDARRPFVAATTETEIWLAATWSTLLEIDTLGIHDHFFEMGGHSLLATRVMARIGDHLGLALPVKLLFEHPTIAALAAVIDESSPEEGLSILHQSPHKVPRAEVMPLSFSQERLWFLHELEPDSPAYHIHHRLSLHGPLDVGRFLDCLNHLVGRHETLRTVFLDREDGPIQVIKPVGEVYLRQVDLGTEPEDQRETRFRQIAQEEALRPFDLGKGPLLRTALVRLNAEKTQHALLVTMHHIIADGWSMGVLVQDLVTMYQQDDGAFEQGRMAELTLQYADYAVWQRRTLDEARLNHLLSFWHQQLDAAPTVLEMPTDFPRPAKQTYRGAVYPIRIDQELTTALTQLANQEGASLYMVLLTAYGMVLSLYADQDDLLIGSPVANRAWPSLEPLIGCFVNTLAMRCDFRDAPSLADCLHRVRDMALNAFTHQEMPFEKLVQALDVNRDLSRSPLFQVMFVLQNAPSGNHEQTDLTVVPMDNDQVTAKFDLTLDLVEEQGSLSGHLEYNSDLFAAETVAALSTHFQHALTLMAAGLNQPLKVLSLTTEQERHTLLHEWNQPVVAHRNFQAVHQQIASIADARGEQIAVIDSAETLTYRDLLGYSNALASQLLDKGIGPEQLVGVCMERHSDLMITLLGILQAGAAYVPMDPSFPKERLAFMANDADLPLVLCDETNQDLAQSFGRPVLMPRKANLTESTMPPIAQDVTSDHMAYTIYTSGSTGLPKGVQISHGALVHFLNGVAEKPGMTDADRLLSVTTMSFDIFGLEAFLPLISGATLILAPTTATRDGRELAALIESSAATVMQATPATYAMLIEDGWQPPESFRILCGGDVLPLETVRTLAPHVDQFWNLYGPTEATIWATTCQVDPNAHSVSIGSPLRNATTLVLDHQLDLCPIGIAGDLYIGGGYLARGYLGRASLTAERFVPNPFSNQAGDRLYQTGDRARYRRDGMLTFLGRSDFQIKLRGYRIELGDIETHLADHPAVRAAVALVIEEGNNQRLIAYWLQQDQAETPTQAELRGYLADKLPAYMLPDQYVKLEAFPLTPNRKVDRKQLSQLPSVAPTVTTATTATPQVSSSDVERKVAAAWADILGQTSVPTNQPFFEIGGHSLLMLRLRRRLEEDFQRTLDVASLFQYPTIRDQARFLSAGQVTVSQEDKYAGRSGQDRGPIAVIGMAGRFPGAANLEQYWQNLAQGVESIRFFDDEELLARGIERDILDREEFIRAGSVLDGVEHFDAAFFGYTPREAEMMDPQHRLFLETCWHALEHAGYNPQQTPGKVGVFSGQGINGYFLNHVLPNMDRFASLTGRHLLTTDKDFLSTRVSFKLNLEGPSLTVQTACSTSLVAIHLACKSIVDGECSMALAGGVTVNVIQDHGYLHETGGHNSPDGHCRPFDRDSGGTLFGSGVGVVALKSLDQAIADGDSIMAVIKGSAINNDGSAKVGYMAPSVTGQVKVMTDALNRAGVQPGSIDYVEAHGTGTRLGDPIEVAALNQAYRLDQGQEKKIALGSVKSNFGHLDAAAGVAGFIKTVLALKHQVMPPSINFTEPNPEIDFASGPFAVNPTAISWPREETPRRAAVSSLGLGGTNAHLVLEEYMAQEPSSEPSDRDHHLLFLSARTRSSLQALQSKLADHLARHPEQSMDDVAFTLLTGRQVMAQSKILVCRDREDALAELTSDHSERIQQVKFSGEDARVAFLFPGQSAQHVWMGWELYQSQPAFAEALDRCSEILRPLLGLDLRHVLYPSLRDDQPVTPELEAELQSQLSDVNLSLAAIFSISYSLAKLWQSWGLVPSAMLGFSLGEYVAACLAGVFSLEDGLNLVVQRARLIDTLDEGAMVSVRASEESLRDYVSADVALAAVNGPNACVLSGTPQAMRDLCESLDQENIEYRFLKANRAGHSHMMEAIGDAFHAVLEGIELHEPQFPYLSCTTGTWMIPEEATSPAYWVRHLRQTVRFADAMATLLSEDLGVFLEVGPGKGLTSLLGQQPNRQRHHRMFSTMRHPKEEIHDVCRLLETLGGLHAAGVRLDWSRYFAGERRARLPVPTYPFAAKRYWINAPHDRRRFASSADSTAMDSATHDRPELESDFEPPDNQLQQHMIEMWQSQLGFGNIGIHDSFFELGGESLAAASFTGKLHKQLDVKVGLADFFRGPTIYGLSRTVARILEEHNAAENHPARQLLNTPVQAMDQEADATAPNRQLAQAPIPVLSRDQPLPLSFAQQRLWFFHRLDPESNLYNIPFGMDIQGPLKVEAFHQALQAVVARHEALRTRFTETDGKAHQIVVAEQELDWLFLDWSATEVGSNQISDLLKHTQAQPFDFETGPLFRCRLVALGEDHHLLVLVMHHMIADAWSFNLFLGELIRGYEALLEHNQIPTSSELAIQYPDFAAWQRDQLDSGALVEDIEFWRTYLADAPELLQLPSDFPRPQQQSHRGDYVRFALDPETTAGLKAFSKKRGVTLFMTVLSAFKILLSRYARQEDICVGIPVAGRGRPEIEPLIGFFVNMMVSRTKLSGNPTIDETLARVQESTVEAYQHSHVPFEFLIQSLEIARDQSRTPLFQAMLNLPEEIGGEEMPGQLQISPLEFEGTVSKYDLSLELLKSRVELAGYFEFNTDLFSRETVARMGKHLELIFEAMLQSSEQTIHEIPLRTPAEITHFEQSWTHANQAPLPGDTIAERFSAVAAVQPSAIALTGCGSTLSFATLDERANQIAHGLLAQGLKQEECVGVCMRRSPELIASLLGILKAGGAYLYLDPKFPEERLEMMMEPTGLSIVLGQSDTLDRPVFEEKQIFTLGGEDNAFADHALTKPTPFADPDHLAYLIFTSGSTGRPKGIMTTHRAIFNRLNWMWEDFPFAEGDINCQKTSLNFVDSTWEIWGPLLQGKPVVLIPEEEVSDTELFVERLAEAEVTRLVLVPSLLQVMLNRYPDLGKRLPQLTFWVTSGEPLPSGLLARFKQSHPQARLLNLYGSSEVAADVTFLETTDDHAASHAPSVVPLGHALPNLRLGLFNPYGWPTPQGAWGEICVLGVQNARGYLGQPAQTALRFRPAPQTDLPGARMYHTGDLGRFSADGTLLFGGRADDQIKIRGFRIELGDIHHQLQSHPEIAQLVVTTFELGGEHRIAAYFIPKKESSPQAASLLDYLRDRLPEYMLPTAFIELDAFPKTATGKIDRGALPRPNADNRISNATFVPLETETERLIAGVWQEILSCGDVGQLDSFFLLGGHSLLGIQVISRLQEIFAVTIPLKVLFDAPILKDQAEALEHLMAHKSDVDSQAPGLQPVERTGHLPLSFSQQRLWFLDRLEPVSGAYLLSYAYRLEGTLNDDRLKLALAAVIHRHESLRTVFAVDGQGQPYQVILETMEPPLVTHDLTAEPEAQRQTHCDELMNAEKQRPMDLATGPLLRLALLRLSPTEQILILTTHHIISDAWSLNLLLEELVRSYQALQRGEMGPTFPPLPIQYADYAVWQRHWLSGPRLERQLAYWQEQLANAPQQLEIPEDFRRPNEQTYRGNVRHFVWDQDLTHQLEQLGQSCGATLFMTVLASYQLLLAKYSGQEDILIGTPIANRDHADVEPLIGFFLNTLVLRLDSSGDPTVSDLIRRARGTTLSAYQHQDVPVELLIQELNVDRDMARSPLFQTMLVFKNVPDEVDAGIVAGDFTVHHLDEVGGFAKFDLSIEFKKVHGKLYGMFEYATDLFSEQTIERMVTHLTRIAEDFVTDPQQSISDLSLLNRAEQAELVAKCQGPDSRLIHAADGSTVHQSADTLDGLWRDQVAKTPDQPALIMGDVILDFQTLDAKANRLAHLLRDEGVACETPVGLFGRRTLEAILTWLAVWKAGGVMVYLDPGHPSERLRQQVQTAGLNLIIQTESGENPFSDSKIEPLRWEDLQSSLAQWPDTPPVPVHNHRHAGYIVFTSGSTGTPKAVIGTHEAVINRFRWMWQTYPFSSGERCCQKTSFNFVDALWEVWGPLLNGISLDIFPDELITDPGGFIEALAERNISRLLLVPSHLRLLLEQPGCSNLSGIQLWSTSGEALKEATYRRFRELLPDASLLNLYGSSEVAADATHQPLVGPINQAIAPLGQPISQMASYVVDRQLNLQPVGLAGEIAIAGTSLARGYLGNARQTAQSFVPNPFSTDPGKRLYRTGDRGHYQADGCLAFLGRIDQQVKIRGFRVELGEVSHALEQLAGVVQATAIIQPGPGGFDQIVAFFVGASEAPTVEDLMAALRLALPDYMVPANLVALEQFPRTATGKIDRRALQNMEIAGVEDDHTFCGPRDNLETVLCGLWAQVLERPTIDIHQNFFQLGGHSLLAAQLAMRINETFQIDLPLRFFFEATTVALLAEKLRTQEEVGDQIDLMAELYLEITSMSESEIDQQL